MWLAGATLGAEQLPTGSGGGNSTGGYRNASAGTSTISSVGGASTTGGASSIGGVSATGGGLNTGGYAGIGGAPFTGGAPATGGASWTGCSQAVIPTTPGNLSITSGYLTKGSLHGNTFTWNSYSSNTATCITPTCGASGCTPAFGSSSICAAGFVAADTAYNSIVGLGFNLNQNLDGGTAGSIPIASSVTVTTYVGRQIGDAFLRVQLTTQDGTSYCVEAGKWTSGTPIPISAFNTRCWDSTMSGAIAAVAGTQVTSLNLVIPSDAAGSRPFDVCLLDVAVQ